MMMDLKALQEELNSILQPTDCPQVGYEHSYLSHKVPSQQVSLLSSPACPYLSVNSSPYTIVSAEDTQHALLYAFLPICMTDDAPSQHGLVLDPLTLLSDIGLCYTTPRHTRSHTESVTMITSQFQCYNMVISTIAYPMLEGDSEIWNDPNDKLNASGNTLAMPHHACERYHLTCIDYNKIKDEPCDPIKDQANISSSNLHWIQAYVCHECIEVSHSRETLR